MIEKILPEVGNATPAEAVLPTKPKRDIVHFMGDKPVSINMDHVCGMRLEEKTLFFDFYTKTQPVEMVDEDIAKTTFQSLMNVWCGNVVE